MRYRVSFVVEVQDFKAATWEVIELLEWSENTIEDLLTAGDPLDEYVNVTLPGQIGS